MVHLKAAERHRFAGHHRTIAAMCRMTTRQ